MSTIFFTGFPGFLGSKLLPLALRRALETDSKARAVCLVQGKFAQLAQRRADEIVAEHPELEGRIDLVEGDITQPGLGLGDASEIKSSTSEIYHLAAVYDLAVPRSVGMRVNVDGTRHVLDFGAACPHLDRFQYVSTCYVSGRWVGAFTEDDLVKGQEFNNYYEETKFLAEVDVQERMQHGLPATVYRPSVVVGDSQTGETQKYDGPYYVIRWLLRNPPLAVLPMIGDAKIFRVNLVPSDFVVDAIAHLSGVETSRGKVYQLSDPAALTVDELVDAVARATGRTVIRLPLPKALAKGAIEYVPFVGRILQIPSTSVDYFVHPTHYTSRNTERDLAGTGIAAPPLVSYLDKLVAFVKAHPEIGSEAMT